MGTRIRDYMSSEFITVAEHLMLRDALNQMLDQQVDFMVVTQPNLHVVGVLTEIDVIEKRDHAHFADLHIADVVDKVFSPTLSPEDFMENAAELVVKHHNIDQIVVVERLCAVGVVQKRDILRWMRDQHLQGDGMKSE